MTEINGVDRAKQMIQGALERPDLTLDEKKAVMGGNAKRFFRLQ